MLGANCLHLCFHWSFCLLERTAATTCLLNYFLLYPNNYKFIEWENFHTNKIPFGSYDTESQSPIKTHTTGGCSSNGDSFPQKMALSPINTANSIFVEWSCVYNHVLDPSYLQWLYPTRTNQGHISNGMLIIICLVNAMSISTFDLYFRVLIFSINVRMRIHYLVSFVLSGFWNITSDLKLLLPFKHYSIINEQSLY